jgi:hypothetical protein
MKVLSGGGVFSRQNIADINQNFQQIQADYYLDGQYGYDGNPGTSPGLAFRTPKPLDLALPNWRRLHNTQQTIRVAIAGVLTYEWNAPIVNNVALIGAPGNPRQATTSGIANGGGSTWLSPTSATDSLLTINGQAWTVQNIYFNNSCTTATTGCIELVGGGDPPLTADAGHSQIVNCRFIGEANGLYINGGPGFLLIQNNIFQNFDTSGDCAILAGGSGGTGWQTRVLDNVFTANLTHLKPLSAAYGWEVAYNRFSYIDVGVTTTTQIDFTGGNNNSVHNNYFDLPYTTTGLAAMFVLGTNDRWYFNEFATAVGTTIFSFGGPQTS